MHLKRLSCFILATLFLLQSTFAQDARTHHTMLEPVDLKVSVSPPNWVQTISICNTTSRTIPLTHIEFDFNYGINVPSNLWGTPWVAWKVQSQTGTQVILSGGTPYSQSLPPDSQCANPLSISFNSTPSSPAPAGPFVFKADFGGVSKTGGLSVNLAKAPTAGLPNPTLTVVSKTANFQKTLPWGSNWLLPNLAVDTYSVSGNNIVFNGQTYQSNQQNINVLENQTTTATVYYSQSNPTNTLSIQLINPPSPQVPVNFIGTQTYHLMVQNGSNIQLVPGTYQVSSNIPGYNFTATPNPVILPTNNSLTISYTPVGSNTAGSRTVNFVNQCPFPVWFGFISGATPNRNGGDSCNTDADCWPNNTCVNRGGGGNHCFWTNPIPADNNFQLAPNGGTNSVLIPYNQNPMNGVFSGAAAGRTNCTAAGCETGDCGGGIGGCAPGKGFNQPATQAEFTFNTNMNDYYDIEAVNGLNIPVAMSPIGVTSTPTDPYYCGSPGSTQSTTQIGACSWNLSPTQTEFNWVRAGGNGCNSNADCQGPNRCGLSFNPGKTPLLQKTCGQLLGFWNANQICGVDSNYGAPFNCQQQLPAPNQDFKVYNLLGCAPIPSCYQNGAGNNCCGCVNWDQVGVNVPPAPFTKQCVSSNDYWVNHVMPDIKWIKEACPTVYTYPFDDMSSTFQCQQMKSNNNGNQLNSVGYTITFCPDGKTGGI